MSRPAGMVADMCESPCLEAVDLDCIRGDRVLFSQLSFRLEPGLILQLEGENGCGKTSLLRILCGISLPDSGEVHWCGQDIAHTRSEYLTNVAYIGHMHGVKGELSPLENLRATCAIGGSQPRLEFEEALERIGLLGFESLPCRTLSAGQKRRVALARLWVTGARLWFLDEPFTALDKGGIGKVEEVMGQHTGRGGMVALTTHHHLNMDRLNVSSMHLGT
jgi:heme exporter protein A